MTPSAHRSDPDLVVLHALRVIGSASADRVAVATGLTAPTVESELIDLALAGQVSHLRGVFGGWSLTEGGKTADAERIAQEVAAAGARDSLEAGLGGFLVLNPVLLQVCTDWQLRPVGDARATNDHRDPRYDARVLDRLQTLHRRAEPVCNGLAAALTRFTPYRPRLALALERAAAGDPAAVTESTESYHAVWFQLHEDLLVTLGRPRW